MSMLDYEPTPPDDFEFRRVRRQAGWFLIGTGVAAPGVAVFAIWAMTAIGVAVADDPGDPNLGVGLAAFACLSLCLLYAFVAMGYGISLLVRSRG